MTSLASIHAFHLGEPDLKVMTDYLRARGGCVLVQVRWSHGAAPDLMVPRGAQRAFAGLCRGPWSDRASRPEARASGQGTHSNSPDKTASAPAASEATRTPAGQVLGRDGTQLAPLSTRRPGHLLCPGPVTTAPALQAFYYEL